ncbi:YceI family protein [Myxococcota bacterium]|nr:YceI family protein [Myxococcota bacterium]
MNLSAALLTLGLVLSSAPAAAAFQVTGKPKVTFYAEGSPGALDIEGKSGELSLSDDGTTVTAKVPLASVSTGIDLRDDHMKNKYMAIATFPDLTLRFARAELKLPTDAGQSTTGTLAATFNAHGVDQPVTVTYTVKKGKNAFEVDASFDYDISKHGVEIPSYLGITVDPAQNAKVRFEMLDQ